jgi:hypothetical protein
LMGIVGTITVRTFYNFRDIQSVDKEADTVLEYIQKARNQSISDKNHTQYGVNFASSTITFFEGTSYATSSASNILYTISPSIEMSAISLTGGTRSVYFNMINGKANATGTITYRLKSDVTKTRSIIIYGSGLSEIQ